MCVLLSKLEEKCTQLSDVRGLFDTVSEKFPETPSCLSPTAAVIHIHDFDSTIVKVQLGKSSSMTGEECSSVSALELPRLREPSFRDNALPFAECTKKQKRNSSLGERTHVDFQFNYLRRMSANASSRKLVVF